MTPKKIIRGVIIVMALFFPLLQQAHALDVPKLQGHVNDYARLFSSGAVQEVERLLSDFEERESTQIVVLTIPSLAGESLEEYSIKVAEVWRIGQKGLDNGAILLIAAKERKLRIEVGRGLEGKLTDLISGQIIRDEMTPKFRSGDFDGGLKAGVFSMMSAVKGEFQAQKKDLRHARRGAPPIFALLLFLFVVIAFVGAMSKILGGVAGAIGLPFAASMAFPGLSLIVLAILAAAGLGAGLFASFLFGSGFATRGGSHWSGPFFGGFGGGSFGGGGGFGGGSSGDGGFSGGGGDFGGGGASGDW